MVQASTLIIAAFAVAPVLAAPLHGNTPKADAPHTHHKLHSAVAAAPEHEPVAERSILDDATLISIDARSPDPFSFGKAFKKIGRVASKVGGVALKAAPLLLLRDDGELEIQIREVPELDARAPFSFKKAFRKVSRVASKAAGIATKVAPLILRDEDGTVYEVRELALDDELELDAREPINWGKIVRGASRGVKQATRVASTAGKVVSALGLRELSPEDMLELEERDLLDFDELDERELAELDARFNIGNFWKKATGTAGKVLNVVDKVSSKAHGLGLRELDLAEEMDMEAREETAIDELD